MTQRQTDGGAAAYELDWSLSQHVEHACSLALGYGPSGRPDVLYDYQETKQRLLARLDDIAPTPPTLMDGQGPL